MGHIGSSCTALTVLGTWLYSATAAFSSSLSAKSCLEHTNASVTSAAVTPKLSRYREQGALL